ncbi:pseudaminic acid synthase, partial [Enterococcus hirae]
GNVDYGRKSSEQGNAQFRRSLYFVEDLEAGAVITAESVRSVRPGFGLAPKFMDEVVGKKVSRDVRKNTPVKADVIEGWEF